MDDKLDLYMKKEKERLAEMSDTDKNAIVELENKADILFKELGRNTYYLSNVEKSSSSAIMVSRIKEKINKSHAELDEIYDKFREIRRPYLEGLEEEVFGNEE